MMAWRDFLRSGPLPPRSLSRRRDVALTLLAGLAGAAALWLVERHGQPFVVHMLTLAAIYATLAVSYNLINGVAGQFSLEPNAFVACGAYVTALLTMTPDEKAMTFILEPLIWPFSDICLPLPAALLIAGCLAVALAFAMGFPVFRVRGDYLAIVTLGFGEVIRVVAENAQGLTNGPLGLKGIERQTNLWWSWGLLAVTLIVVGRLVNSSYGRAMKAVREDESAAAAMGVNVFWHKMLAFCTSAFFEGVAGGLLAHLLTAINPRQFDFLFTFTLLIIIVAGGLGSTTGAVLGAFLVTFGAEYLRFVDQSFTIPLIDHVVPATPGLRMVIFSLLLVGLMLFARRGIMGRAEFSWRWLAAVIGRRRGGGAA